MRVSFSLVSLQWYSICRHSPISYTLQENSCENNSLFWDIHKRVTCSTAKQSGEWPKSSEGIIQYDLCSVKRNGQTTWTLLRSSSIRHALRENTWVNDTGFRKHIAKLHAVLQNAWNIDTAACDNTPLSTVRFPTSCVFVMKPTVNCWSPRMLSVYCSV